MSYHTVVQISYLIGEFLTKMDGGAMAVLHTPTKLLREAAIENEFLGFDDACREDAAASSKGSMIILFRSIRLLQCI